MVASPLLVVCLVPLEPHGVSTTDMLYGTIGARHIVSEKLADWAV